MNKKILFITVPVIVLIIALLSAILFVSGKPENKIYVQNMDLAEKCLSDNDYDNAIIYLNKAIQSDVTQEEAYISLANVYVMKNDIYSALSILKGGYANTNSDKINDLISYYSGDFEEKNSELQPLIFKMDDNTITKIAQFTTGDYANEYTIESSDFSSGVYTIRYIGIPADFIYYNSDNNNVLDNNNKPFSKSKPCQVKYDGINSFITGFDGSFSIDDLKGIGINGARKVYNDSLKADCIQFDYLDCRISIECNSDGVVESDDAINCIEPLSVEFSKKVMVTGEVRDVVTNDIVENYTIKFRLGKNTRSGEAVATCTSEYGKYNIELSPENYTVEISSEGYVTEYFNVYVSSTEETINKNFNISPNLIEGEIRFVLEWGNTPEDLDSHLSGRTKKGSQIHVYYQNKEERENGETVAELDLDDRDGNGPETTTLHNSSGEYVFTVKKFSGSGTLASSGATVKVYLPGSSDPKVYSVPTDLTGTEWVVCKIENGRLV